MARRHRAWRLWPIILGVVVAVALAVVVLFPTGKYVEVPGQASVTSHFVHVQGHHDRQQGSYRLMTVSVIGPATPAILIWAHFQPFAEVDSQASLMGNASTREYNQLQRYYIKSAANGAVVSAMRAAGRPVQIREHGIYVMSLLKDSPLRGHVRVGDTITQVDNHSYHQADDFVKAIARHHVGQRVRVTYTHKGRTHRVTVPLVWLRQTKRAGIGITLTDHTVVTSQPQVRINAGSIGGPSAGLMFALETYQQVTGRDLRRGRTVAGTGTIDNDGHVGVIGGIDKKVYAAAKAGATVFFAPDVPATKAMRRVDPGYVNNYVDAKRAAKKMGTRMRIIPVKSLRGAIDYLKK